MNLELLNPCYYLIYAYQWFADSAFDVSVTFRDFTTQGIGSDQLFVPEQGIITVVVGVAAATGSLSVSLETPSIAGLRNLGYMLFRTYAAKAAGTYHYGLPTATNKTEEEINTLPATLEAMDICRLTAAAMGAGSTILIRIVLRGRLYTKVG